MVGAFRAVRALSTGLCRDGASLAILHRSHSTRACARVSFLLLDLLFDPGFAKSL